MAVGLLGAGIGFTVWLGVASASEEPVDQTTAGLLVLVAGGFQLAGATVLHSVGKAEPSLARAAVRGLLLQVKRAQGAEEIAQVAFETGTAAERRQALGTVSVHLSYLAEGAVNAIGDWREFHERAVERLVEEEELD